MKTKVIFAFLLFANVLYAADPKVTAVRFGKLWDGEKVINGALVVIEGDRIRSITGGNPSPPAGAEVIDWSRYYGLPGLIDVHTHMMYAWDRRPGTRPRGGQADTPAVTVVIAAKENATKTLEAGVTAVRDLNARDYTDIALRDLINRGLVAGPRMYVCGAGLMTSRSFVPGATTPPPPGPGTADSVDEVMRAVRRQIAAGADVVKMFASVGGFDNVGTQQTFTYEEMKAAVDVAHAMGKKIAIHSYGPQAARDAVRAGPDSIEHGIDFDDWTISEMVRKKIFFVPTIDHNRYYIDAAAEYGFPPGAKERLQAYIDKNFECAQRAYKAGVRFAMGSDAVYTMFGQNTRELAWFVKLGMTPEQALKTATVDAAELLDKTADIGSVTSGHFADMIAVEGDPLADIQVAINNVRMVMKGGVVVVKLGQRAPSF